ncbi:MAG: hypothetical protein KF787_07680 [Phycisphaeraceae bacterium]|nr:hypothetical protein [Phycisphaerae bacterium]MBX3392512.1 hypothetical protein [Phycisphaeraceae bacterium]
MTDRSERRTRCRTTGEEGMDAVPALTRPASRHDLRHFLHQHLDLRFADDPIVPGHHSPIDYLCHAFFEGEPPLPDAAAPAGRQAPIVDCVVWANRGGGKTMLGAVATLMDMVYKPGIHVRILGGSLEQAERMHTHLRGFLAREPFRSMVRGRVTDRRIVLRNTSEVELLAQSQTSVRGTRVQKIRCDEVELFDPAVWEAAQLVTRSQRCGGTLVRGAVECLSTMHIPGGIMHDLVGQAAAGTRRLFKWGVLDVLERCEPARDCGACALYSECSGRAKRRQGAMAGHVTIDDALVMKSRVGTAVWETEMLCSRPSRTAAVLPEFDRCLHVVSEEPPATDDAQWVGGMDFGMRSPTVILWGMVGADRTVWILHERSVSGATLDDHIAEILDPARPVLRWLSVDPSGAATNYHTGISTTEMMARRGIRVCARPARVHEGLLLIRARLRPADGGPPRLYVHRRCATLIDSMERFSYDDNPQSDAPDKSRGFDHAVDALRYLVHRLDLPSSSQSGSYTTR